MPQGLTACLVPLGPDMWHEFALGLEFSDPHATIDLLLAADAITSHPQCDRATAALILAKAAAAGFHRGEAPAAYDGAAARAFANRLTELMVTGTYASARFALPPLALRLVIRQLGPHGPLTLPPLSLGHSPHRPRYGFSAWHPVQACPQARSA
ncbi:MAG: hypothetical protein WAT09_01805 [Paracoccaceae bacterium]